MDANQLSKIIRKRRSWICGAVEQQALSCSAKATSTCWTSILLFVYANFLQKKITLMIWGPQSDNREILIKAWAMQKIETQAPIAWGISNSLTHALENKESRIAPLKNDWRCSRPSYCLFEIHRWWTQVLFLWVGNLFLLCIPFEGLNHPTRIILAIKPVLNSTLRICRIKNNMQ